MFKILPQIIKESKKSILPQEDRTNYIIMESENIDGSYVGMKLSNNSKLQIKHLNKKLNTPNPLSRDKMHITVIYSKKKIEGFEPKGKMKTPIIASIKGLEIFKSQSNKRVLVLLLNSPELTARHNHIMKKYEATYDFDEYRPHITLSYNVGDWDGYKDFSMNDIKEIVEDGEIEINEEYYEDLDLDWNKTNEDD